MPNSLNDVAARMAALVALHRQMQLAAPEDRAQILDDAIRASGGTTEMLAEDYPAIYEFQIHGLTGNGLDPASAAETWMNLADQALSGMSLVWAEQIVRCPVPGISYPRLLCAAQTVRFASVDPDALYAAERLVDAAEQRAFPEQQCAA